MVLSGNFAQTCHSIFSEAEIQLAVLHYQKEGHSQVSDDDRGLEVLRTKLYQGCEIIFLMCEVNLLFNLLCGQFRDEKEIGIQHIQST